MRGSDPLCWRASDRFSKLFCVFGRDFAHVPQKEPVHLAAYQSTPYIMKIPILFTAIAGLFCSSAVAIPYNVDSTITTGTDTAVLQSGVTYLFEVSGTYAYNNAGNWADAEWSQKGGTTTEIHPGFSFTPATDAHDLAINGLAVDWLGNSGSGWATHTFSPSHVYRYSFVGAGSSVNLTIADWIPLLLNDQTKDNGGSLTVNITSVPDGGITLMLLGLGITGLAVLRRKLT